MEYVVQIDKLNKKFGEIVAVRDLSFRVKKGELFAFLGVNGAGKSTTISIICSQLQMDSGEVFICGQKVGEGTFDYTSKLGVVFQNSVLDKDLTVKDNLRNRAALYGIKGKEFNNRLNELAELLEFKDLLNRTVGKLSGGQKRRIDIARALLHKPAILILDEPTTGLDPQTRKRIWEVVAELREKENITVVLTTHYMEEAADSDYVVIIDKGEIVAEGTPIELKNRYTGDSIVLYGANEAQVKALGVKYEVVHGAIVVSVKNTKEATSLIVSNPELFDDYEILKGKMDDVFISVTGKRINGGDEL